MVLPLKTAVIDPARASQVIILRDREPGEEEIEGLLALAPGRHQLLVGGRNFGKTERMRRLVEYPNGNAMS